MGRAIDRCYHRAVGDRRLENKIRFVARAFVWESRFQRARQFHSLLKSHRQTARDAVDAAKWWGRLLLPADDQDG